MSCPGAFASSSPATEGVAGVAIACSPCCAACACTGVRLVPAFAAPAPGLYLISTQSLMDKKGAWQTIERDRRDRRDRERLDPDVGRLPDRGADLAARRAPRRRRCRRSSSTSPTASATSCARATSRSTAISRSRLCRGAGRPARLGRFRRRAARRVHPAGAGRRARDHRLDRGAALVHRRGRHDGHLLGRLQRAPGRGARTRRRSRRSSRSARPTTATPTTPTTWAAACSTRTCSGARSCSTTAPTRPIRRSSASAGARCGASASTIWCRSRRSGCSTSGATTSGSTARSARTTARSSCAVYAIGGWADGYSNAVPRLLRGLHLPEEGPDRAVGASLPAQRRARARRSASCRRRCAGGTTG